MAVRPYQIAVTELGDAGGGSIIINGQLDIWQRGISFLSVANNTTTADRFRYTKNGTMVNNIARSNLVPTDVHANKAIHSFLVNVTTSQPVVAAGDFTTIQQNIEGYFSRHIQDEFCTLSFFVKSNKTGIYCIAFRNGDLTRSYIKEYTIAVADVWEFKQVVVPVDAVQLDAAGNADKDTNGRRVVVDWTLTAGLNFTTTQGVWQIGNFLATSNQVNFNDSTANNFAIAAVDFRIGDFTQRQLPTYIPRTFIDEVRLCQRYFEKSYDIDVNPGTVFANGALVYDLGSTAGKKYSLQVATGLPTYTTPFFFDSPGAGQKSVEVYVSGVKQVEGAMYSYVATPPNTITFDAASIPVVGQIVEFYGLLTSGTVASGTGGAKAYGSFKVPKRATPIVSLFDNVTGIVPAYLITLSDISTNSFIANLDLSFDTEYLFHWTADGEIV